MATEIVINPVMVAKIQSAFNDPTYKEMVESAAQFNSRLSAERTMRLPFLDSQTGVAQNHSNLFFEPHQRLPGMREGQVYTYPSKRWQKKRRQYLYSFMSPRVARREGENGEPSTSLAVEAPPPVPGTSSGVVASGSGPIPQPSPAPPGIEDLKDVGKEELSKQDWYYDELDVPDAGEFDEPDADSDYDYEESYSKRKKKKPTTKTPRQQNKTRRKITYDPQGDSEKPFACDLCGARYKTRPGLTYHYTHSHKEKDEEEEEMPGGEEVRRRPSNPEPSRGLSGIQPPVLHPQQAMPPTLQPQQSLPSHPPHHGMGGMPGVGPVGVSYPHPHHHPTPPHLVPQQPPHPHMGGPPPPHHGMYQPHHQQQGYHQGPPHMGPGMQQQGPSVYPMSQQQMRPPGPGPHPGPHPGHPQHPQHQQMMQQQGQQQQHPGQGSQQQQHQQHGPPNLPGHGQGSSGPVPSSQMPSGSSGPENDPNFPRRDEGKPRVPPSPYCDFCLGDAVENKKSGTPEELVSCSDCGRSGHPTCLQFTANMIISVKKYRWQCIECKCCSLCGTSDNDDQLLFCDDCDRGYHMYCLVPKLDSPPEGSWSCTLCISEFHKK